MATERDFEEVIAKYPDLIEAGLRLTGRQENWCGRRIDLLFEDRFSRNLLVELKWGPIKDQHIGQLMSYVGMLLSGDHPDIRMMLVGTRVPPNIQKALDFHGIAWKEIRVADLLEFLRSKQDVELASAFEGEVRLASIPALPAKERTGGVTKRVDASVAIGVAKNGADADFFDKHAGDRQCAHGLAYPQTGTMRWKVFPSPKGARVLQKGRFRHDEKSDTEFWGPRLSTKVELYRHGDNLRFYLVDADDFAAFRNVMENESAAFSWIPRKASHE